MQLTQSYILDKYGPLLSQEQVAELFGYSSTESLSNAISSGRIRLSKNGINRYHYIDVANSIDSLAISQQDLVGEVGYNALGMPSRNGRLSKQLQGSKSRAQKTEKSPRA